MYYPNERHKVFLNGTDMEATYQLITAVKPIVSPPEAKTEYVEILGADGLLDLSQSVDGLPHFNNRSLELEFIIRQEADCARVMHSLTTYYHNRRVSVRLPDDDPEYVYFGRVTLNPVEHDGHFHRVTMSVNIDLTSAYKMEEGYIQVPAWGGDDYIPVTGWGNEDGWVQVPAPGIDMVDVIGHSGYIDVPGHGASDYVSVIGWGGDSGGGTVPVPSPGGDDGDEGGTVPVPSPGG